MPLKKLLSQHLIFACVVVMLLYCWAWEPWTVLSEKSQLQINQVIASNILETFKYIL